ncbi:MAG TPA: rhamnulokinase [Lachnospiraceae bacterium]|nr:rhamnulokinase [Lachnospiraceae bacterium]
MEKYFLAIDIGASSGRHILGSIKNGKMELEEVYRFWNGMDKVDGTWVWNLDRLVSEIITGMKKCGELGKIPESVGVDTWGVDFVLLDEKDEIIGKPVGYRDHRTDGMDREVYKIISEEELYKRTGIQKAIYNTVYQLMAVKLQNPGDMEKAKAMLMLPDYFHYRLCGNKVQEYSEATTGQLIDPKTRNWDYELIDMLGFNRDMFLEIRMPGTVIGTLTPEVREAVGYDCKVVLPPTHDTASAVMAIPFLPEMGEAGRSDGADSGDICYISSGTWSLMGVERAEADCSRESMEANFTNEGGYNGRITYLTNIMGLWMIQSVRGKLAPEMSYAKICEDASKEKIASIVDCQDECFLSPDDMAEAIRDYCRKTSQQVPETLPELAAVIYNSLAKCYMDKLKEIEKLSGKKYDRIHIIGGGSNAVYLNELTAKYTGIPVYAGPGEATAIGNVLAQMLASGVFRELSEARECVGRSFEVKVFN